MPGGDRRGPEGRGPRTGRGLGYCNDGATGFFSGGPGRRMGYGRGRRRGRDLGIWRDPDTLSIVGTSRSPETIELKEKIRSLEEELQRTRDRLDEK